MIGLLTFTEADNYGALLQAYALQTTLKSMGEDSVFLNIKPPVKSVERDLSKLPAALRRKIEETIEHHVIRSGRFQEFRNERLKLSDYIPPEQMGELNKRFDCFIVGSDQVWNCGITGNDLRYALSFADKTKRFSYAASFGGEEGLKKATEDFWNELAGFNRISLREEDGIRLCYEMTGIVPSVNVDPCLLLDKSEWVKILPGDVEPSEKYVLLFLIEYDQAFYEQAKAFSEQKNLILRIITSSYIPQFGFEAYSGTGVTQWLKAIFNAEYVFCDSFHACVFSILFEKNFAANLSRKRLEIRSSRVVHLLDRFGLDTQKMNEDVEYGTIRRTINLERERSLSYLREIVK